MVFKFTKLHISDNSGGKTARCIHVFSKIRQGFPPDELLVSMLKCFPRKKVKKGLLYKAILIRTSAWVKHIEGPWWHRYHKNDILLLNKRLLPIGSRVKGPLPGEVRLRRYAKLIALATVVI